MYAVEMKNITMMFNRFKANDDITFKVKQGEIHALIGENGAGKSTLMSVLFGIYRPTLGSIYINEKVAHINSPIVANHYGIGMVHQHFKLVEDFSVLENIVLNDEKTLLKTLITYKQAREKIKEIMEKYNFKINLDKKIFNCSVAEQQRVEILKMLYRDAEILIFDEPTAVLSPTEIEQFLIALKELQKKGKTIIIISHKIDELKKVANRGTIIRKGALIGEIDIKKASMKKISEMMVGSSISIISNKHQKIADDKVVKIEGLSVAKLGKSSILGLKNLDLEINAGEIVAIAGVEGNGQTELINAITGLQKIKKGKIQLKVQQGYILDNNNQRKNIRNGLAKKEKLEFKLHHLKEKIKELKRSSKNEKNTAILLAKQKLIQKQIKTMVFEPKWINFSSLNIQKKYLNGMSHVPEDRHKYGLVLDMNLYNNSILQDYYHWPFSKLNVLNPKAIKNHSKKIIEKFDVRCSEGQKNLASSLSGGNQQKFILGRELIKNSSLMIIAQPTRGLDVGAITNIHDYILQAKAEGKAILLISYELDEIISLADRIVVLNANEKVGELPAKGITKNVIGKLMAGQKIEMRNYGKK